MKRGFKKEKFRVLTCNKLPFGFEKEKKIEADPHIEQITMAVNTYMVHMVLRCYTVKKVSDFPVPSPDVPNQTLPDREKFYYSRPGGVWLVKFQLATGKSLTFF